MQKYAYFFLSPHVYILEVRNVGDGKAELYINMDSLICVTYNVKGLGSPIKRKKILSQLKKLHCSIAMIQETHMSEKEHLKLKREWVGQVFSSSFESSRKRGVAILVNKSVYFSHIQTITDKEGRYVMVKGTIGGTKITLLNLYAPNEDSRDFFKNIGALVADKAEGIILIGGDCNCVLRENIDRLPATVGPASKKSTTLQAMMHELGLIDVWRYLHPREKDFTFMSHVHGSYSRLDMFLISGTELYRTSDCNIEPITISDHAPVTLKLSMGPRKQFKYWRLNVSLLSNELIKEEIQKELLDYMALNDNGSVSPSTLWEGAKVVMRGKIIAISSRLKKERLSEQNKLEKEIKDLESEHKQTNNPQVLGILKETRQKLDDLLTFKTEGALRFINRKYYEMGNRASRLLAFQLRKEQSNRTVHKISCPHLGRSLTQPNEIAEAFATYYKKLYEEERDPHKEDKVKHFLKLIKLNTLTPSESEVISSPITDEEIKESILKLKNNKSPGTDGFPGEYYKTFVNKLIPLLNRVYNYALREGDPPHSWSEAVISVIHKENKDPTQCMSYRPISLLCVDLKILTSIIAKRIQKYIHKLVKPDQTGFITNRQGVDNVRKALNLQAVAVSRDVPSMLLSLDAEKAFDRLDLFFLQQTLRNMGFNETFIKWIKMFYKNPISRVRVNGHCSHFFPLGRGTRQGDSLSPSLFALSIEPLAELIRTNSHIQGIRDEGNIQHKISLFADDILVFIENPITSIPALMDSLNAYSSVSGYKVNTDKSEAMMIVGSWPTQLDNLVSFKRSQQGFRYLGILLTPKPSQLYNANYNKLIKEINIDISRWEMLPLSLFGRVESVRMNVLPRFLFLFQSLPIIVPQSTFRMLEKRISKFIWQNKRPRVRLKVLMSSKQKGGLGLPNLKLYYWAAQLRAMVAWIARGEMGWVSIEQSSLPGIALDTLPFLSQQSQKKIKVKNMYTKYTLKVWNTIQRHLKGKASLSRAMPIVGNIEFLPSLVDIVFRRWAEKGLRVINQLLDGQVVKTFSQIKDKFDLPQTDFYRYLQIRNYITKHPDWDILKEDPNSIEAHFAYILEHRIIIKHQVSQIYQKLTTDMSDNTLHIKGQWELELNTIIENDEWEDICSKCHRGVGSQLWKEFDWKVKVRFFRTPLQVSIFNIGGINKCWRNCGMVGDHTHIFWDCPKIQPYWRDIKTELEKILHMDIPFDPVFILLEKTTEQNFSKDLCYILHVLLMIARKMITMHWMQPEPPTVAQWRLRCNQVQLMENMTAILQLKLPLFLRRWTPVILYMG